MAKPKIDQLLIDTALQPDLCRRLKEAPDEVFPSYDLTVEEREILRRPDHRMLSLLGAALARQIKPTEPVEESPAVAAPAPAPATDARALPDALMGLTIVPCALRENGEFKGITYVVWFSQLAEGADPASVPAPAGTAFPGQPLAALLALIRISAASTLDAAGNPRLSLSGTFPPSAYATVPPPPEALADLAASPFQSPLDSAPVQAAVAAVRGASTAERYDRLVDLLHALHQGNVR